MAQVVVRIHVDPNGKIDKKKDPHVVVKVGDTVAWTCDAADFMVYEGTDSRSCGIGKQCLHPETPFKTKLKHTGKYTAAKDFIHSLKVKPEARGHVYKMTWELGANGKRVDLLDPHIIVE